MEDGEGVGVVGAGVHDGGAGLGLLAVGQEELQGRDDAAVGHLSKKSESSKSRASHVSGKRRASGEEGQRLSI